jgi:hypothetical protein
MCTLSCLVSSIEFFLSCSLIIYRSWHFMIWVNVRQKKLVWLVVFFIAKGIFQSCVIGWECQLSRPVTRGRLWKKYELRAERQLGHYSLDRQHWVICNVCRRKLEPPGGNLHLSHEEWVWPGIEPTTSEVTAPECLWQGWLKPDVCRNANLGLISWMAAVGLSGDRICVVFLTNLDWLSFTCW